MFAVETDPATANNLCNEVKKYLEGMMMSSDPQQAADIVFYTLRQALSQYQIKLKRLIEPPLVQHRTVIKL